MKLKVKAHTDLSKYGFVRYNKTDNDCYKVCSKNGLGIVVTVIDGKLDFWAEVDRIAPRTENYFTLDDNAFDEETYRDDVNDLLCEEQELKDFATLLARLYDDKVLEVVVGE